MVEIPSKNFELMKKNVHYSSSQSASAGFRGATAMMRTVFYGSVYPAFAPDHVTAHLVAQWVNIFAITAAWIALGGIYATSSASAASGRSGELAQEGEEEEEEEERQVWMDLLPDSEQVREKDKAIPFTLS